MVVRVLLFTLFLSIGKSLLVPVSTTFSTSPWRECLNCSRGVFSKCATLMWWSSSGRRSCSQWWWVMRTTTGRSSSRWAQIYWYLLQHCITVHLRKIHFGGNRGYYKRRCGDCMLLVRSPVVFLWRNLSHVWDGVYIVSLCMCVFSRWSSFLPLFKTCIFGSLETLKCPRMCVCVCVREWLSCLFFYCDWMSDLSSTGHMDICQTDHVWRTWADCLKSLKVWHCQDPTVFIFTEHSLWRRLPCWPSKHPYLLGGVWKADSRGEEKVSL